VDSTPNWVADAAEDDGPHAALAQFAVEFGHRKRAPGGLGDCEVAGLGKAGRKIDEAGRQHFGQRERLVDGARLILGHGRRVDQHDRRAFSAKPCRQRLARFEQLVGGERLEFETEDPFLQVDQH
jgi:hypothetical protein